MSGLPETKITTLTKSEYNDKRHIPNANPLHRASPEKNASRNVNPTTRPYNNKRPTPR